MSASSFAIISTQRSGSTYIRTSLDSHAEVCCAGEVFLPHYNKEHSFHEWLKYCDTSYLEGLIGRTHLVYRFLDSVYAAKHDGAQGFKFMYSQARWVPYCYPMVMKYFKDRNVRIIHVVRNNFLEMCISREMAKFTGVYHSKDASEVTEHKMIHVSVPRVLRSISRMERERSAWCARLQSYESLEVSYEDFVRNNEEVSRRMLGFLGVNPDVRLTSSLKKVIRAPIDDVVENYAELAEALRSNGYARFL